jgi:hypothetical protein
MRWLAVPILAGIAASIAWAAPVDGKWSWKQMRGENEVTFILELKADGEKLTGSLMQQGNDQKTEIKEGTIKGADIAFVVVRTRGDRETRTTYKGKLEGDAIKGTSAAPGRGGGEPRERPWEAKRAQ